MESRDQGDSKVARERTGEGRFTERRAFPRFNILHDIKIETDPEAGAPGERTAIYGVTKDISRGGVLAVVDKAIREGSHCFIRFFLTEGRLIKPETTTGIIRSLQQEDADGFAVHIEFDTLLQQLRLPFSRSHPARSSPLRVLIAEGEELVHQVLNTFLSHHGYDVEVVTDGREALDALRRERWDALLLDLCLPQIDGLDLLNHIREENIEVGTIFAMSGQDDDDAALESVRLGAHDFLARPISLEHVELSLRLRIPEARP